MQERAFSGETAFNHLVHVIGHELCHPAQYEAGRSWIDENDVEPHDRIKAHLHTFNEAQADWLTGSEGYAFVRGFYTRAFTHFPEVAGGNDEEKIARDLASHPQNRRFVAYRKDDGYGRIWEISQAAGMQVDSRGAGWYEDDLRKTVGDSVDEESVTVIDYERDDVPTEAVADYMAMAQREIESLMYWNTVTKFIIKNVDAG